MASIESFVAEMRSRPIISSPSIISIRTGCAYAKDFDSLFG
jgi:hypothetical protein